IAGLPGEIIKRDNRALKRGFPRVLGADLIERLVRSPDRGLHRGIDRFGRLFPIWNGQDGVRLCGRSAKIVHAFQVLGVKSRSKSKSKSEDRQYFHMERFG